MAEAESRGWLNTNQVWSTSRAAWKRAYVRDPQGVGCGLQVRGVAKSATPMKLRWKLDVCLTPRAVVLVSCHSDPNGFFEVTIKEMEDMPPEPLGKDLTKI